MNFNKFFNGYERMEQWRSKALRGPGLTVTWGPYPFPFLPFPSPSFPSLPDTLPLPSLRSRPSLIQLWGLGERCKRSSGVWGGAPAEIEFVAF